MGFCALVDSTHSHYSKTHFVHLSKRMSGCERLCSETYTQNVSRENSIIHEITENF